MASPKSSITRRLFALRLKEDLLTELRHVALDRKQQATQLLEEAIQEWLKKYRGKQKSQSV